MGTPTGNKALGLVGAGEIWHAPLGTAEPVLTATGSVFTAPWTGWVSLGPTSGGLEGASNRNYEDVNAEEFPDPFMTVATSRELTITFSLLHNDLENVQRVFNGGTITQTGTGPTGARTYEEPDLGSELYCMIGWQSTDNRVRRIWRCVKNVEAVEMQAKKAPNANLLKFGGRAITPDGGAKPWSLYTAGTSYTGTAA